MHACVGDTTGQLLWRVMHGEAPAREREPKAAIILIGANDVIASHAVKQRRQADSVRILQLTFIRPTVFAGAIHMHSICGQPVQHMLLRLHGSSCPFLALHRRSPTA